MHFIGVDYPKRYSYLVVKDQEGKMERRGKVNMIKEKFRNVSEDSSPGKAVIEAGHPGLGKRQLKDLLARR